MYTTNGQSLYNRRKGICFLFQASLPFHQQMPCCVQAPQKSDTHYQLFTQIHNLAPKFLASEYKI